MGMEKRLKPHQKSMILSLTSFEISEFEPTGDILLSYGAVIYKHMRLPLLYASAKRCLEVFQRVSVRNGNN